MRPHDFHAMGAAIFRNRRPLRFDQNSAGEFLPISLILTPLDDGSWTMAARLAAARGSDEAVERQDFAVVLPYAAREQFTREEAREEEEAACCLSAAAELARKAN